MIRGSRCRADGQSPLPTSKTAQSGTEGPVLIMSGKDSAAGRHGSTVLLS